METKGRATYVVGSTFSRPACVSIHKGGREGICFYNLAAVWGVARSGKRGKNRVQLSAQKTTGIWGLFPGTWKEQNSGSHSGYILKSHGDISSTQTPPLPGLNKLEPGRGWAWLCSKVLLIAANVERLPSKPRSAVEEESSHSSTTGARSMEGQNRWAIPVNGVALPSWEKGYRTIELEVGSYSRPPGKKWPQATIYPSAFLEGMKDGAGQWGKSSALVEEQSAEKVPARRYSHPHSGGHGRCWVRGRWVSTLSPW